MAVAPRRLEMRQSRLPSFVAAGRTADGRRFATLQDGVVTLWDDRLRPVETQDLAGDRLLAADGVRRAMVTDGDDLVLVGAGGPRRVPGLRGDAASYVGDLAVVTAPAGEVHRIVLVDPRRGAILDETTVDAPEATAFLTPHPSSPALLAEFPMGQDGSFVRSIVVRGDALEVAAVPAGDDAVVAGFDRTGSRVLLTPYPDDPETARIVGWPGLDVRAELTAHTLGTELGIGLPACWVDDGRVALYAMEDALIVVDTDLRRPERVELPVEFGDDGDVEDLIGLAPGRIAAGVWTRQGRRTLIIDL